MIGILKGKNLKSGLSAFFAFIQYFLVVSENEKSATLEICCFLSFK